MSRRTTRASECATPAHAPSAPDVDARCHRQMSAPAPGEMSVVAGHKKKKGMKKLRKEKKYVEEENQRILSMTRMFEDATYETKAQLRLTRDTPLGLQHVSLFLKVLVSEIYLRTYTPVESGGLQRYGSLRVDTPFAEMLSVHRKLCNVRIGAFTFALTSSEDVEAITDACETQKIMDERFGPISSFMYNNYLKYNASKEKRSAEEILSIVNKPDIAYIVDVWEETAQQFIGLNVDPSSRERNSLFRTRLQMYFVRLDSVCQTLRQMRCEMFDEETPDTVPCPGFHFSDWRRPWMLERRCNSTRSEYDRLVQLSKEREAREAEERLAAQRDKDAKIAAQREEKARAAERANQERQDAIVRQLARVNLKDPEPLDAVAAAKAAENEREVRENKERSIAESNARKREQKEKQKAKDAVETKEQEKREHARETAKRIAQGEGYSKRKGNKE